MPRGELLLPLLLCAGTLFAQGGPPATPVAVGVVEKRDLEDRARVTGEVVAVRRVFVAAEEAGIVRRVHVDIGDPVERGAVLVSLDATRLDLEIRQLAARRSVAESVAEVRTQELALAQSDVDSLTRLAERDAVNPKELADARTVKAIAAAKLEESRADIQVLDVQLAVLEHRLRDMEIRAPFDGVVIRRSAEIGGWIGAGDAVAEVVTEGVFDLLLDVPQALVARKAPGNPSLPKVTVEVPAAEMMLIDQEAIMIPAVDRVARTFQVRVRVSDPDGRLADGMSAQGWVPADRRAEVLVVPRDALLENAAGFFVYVVRSVGEGPPQAVPAQVRLRFGVEGGMTVESMDLREGDQVVTEGNERLFPMMPVRIVSPMTRSDGT